MYGFNLTSVNISLIRDARLSVAMIQVNTTHGSGKWAETKVPTWVPTTVPTTLKTRPTLPASIGPVTQLSASLDNNNPSLVHLSWKALSPSGDRGLKVFSRWRFVRTTSCTTACFVWLFFSLYMLGSFMSINTVNLTSKKMPYI